MTKRVTAFLLISIVAIGAASCTSLSSYRYRQWYAMVAPVENYDRYYEDNALSFRFEIEEKKIRLFVTNKGEHDVLLDWPEVRYISPSGKKQQVANLDIIFTKNTQRIKPITVMPGKTEENLIVPLSNMEKIEQWTWTLKPFFNQLDEKALLNKDKMFSVVFPVEMADGEKRTYKFDFKVTSVLAYRGRNPG